MTLSTQLPASRRQQGFVSSPDPPEMPAAVPGLSMGGMSQGGHTEVLQGLSAPVAGALVLGRCIGWGGGGTLSTPHLYKAWYDGRGALVLALGLYPASRLGALGMVGPLSFPGPSW